MGRSQERSTFGVTSPMERAWARLKAEATKRESRSISREQARRVVKGIIERELLDSVPPEAEQFLVNEFIALTSNGDDRSNS